MAPDPTEVWQSKLTDYQRRSYSGWFDRWLEWLHKKPGYENITPAQLVEKQKNAVNDGRYELLDLEQEFVRKLTKLTDGKELARRSKIQANTALRSFFDCNRAELPKDRTFRIISQAPGAPKNLTIQTITEAVIASTIRDRSITLFKWQSFLDNKRMLYVSNNLGEYLANEIRLKHCPIRIVIHGRKQTTQDFYTFIGGDAIAALTEYFEKERGWPKKAEAVWLSKHNRPIVEIDQNYRKLLRRMGVIPEKPKGKPGVDRKSTSTGVRYGYSQHEFRDVAKTLLHVKAKREGLDMDSMKFFMGHLNQLDPNRYDTFYHDIPYMEEQYKIAEPYLNIISQPPGSHETNAQLAKLQEQATKDREEATARLKALEAHVKWLELIRQGKLHPDMTPICPHCEEEQYKVGHTIQYEWDFDGENFKCLRCGGTEWEPSQPVTDREYREIMKRPKKPRAKIKKPKQKKR